MSNQNWRTPQWFYERLGMVMALHTGYVFLLDAATTADNPLGTDNFYTPADNGLVQPWRDATFCNCPWAFFHQWIRKAHREAIAAGLSSCLVGPAGSNQRWFHEIAILWKIYTPSKRIQYIDPATGATPGHAYSNTMAYFFGPAFRNKRRGFDMSPLPV